MSIYKFCKKFRENTLQITLQEMEQITGVNFKTISAFENGRSTNINHINLYIDSCTNSDHDEIFLAGVKQAIKDGKNV